MSRRVVTIKAAKLTSELFFCPSSQPLSTAVYSKALLTLSLSSPSVPLLHCEYGIPNRRPSPPSVATHFDSPLASWPFFPRQKRLVLHCEGKVERGIRAILDHVLPRWPRPICQFIFLSPLPGLILILTFYQRERERYAGLGEPFLCVSFGVSFRLWRLRCASSESSEKVRYAAGVISEKRFHGPLN